MNDRPTREWNGVTIPEPGVYLLDEAHKRIGFQVQHMMVSVVRGEFSRASARITIAEDPLRSSVTATIHADSIDTHTPDRDTHLRSGDFLDVGNYPLITYRSTDVHWPEQQRDEIFLWAQLRNNKLTRRSAIADAPRAAASRKPGRFTVTGELTIRNVRRVVDLQVDFGGTRRAPDGNDIFGFSASAEIDREDFGLVWNVALEAGGVLVGKKIRLELAGEAIHQRTTT